MKGGRDGKVGTCTLRCVVVVKYPGLGGIYNILVQLRRDDYDYFDAFGICNPKQTPMPCQREGKEASFRLSELFGTQNIPELSGSGLKSSDRNGGMTSGRTGCPWLSACTSSQARDLVMLGRCSRVLLLTLPKVSNMYHGICCFCFRAIVYCCYVIHGLS